MLFWSVQVINLVAQFTESQYHLGNFSFFFVLVVIVVCILIHQTNTISSLQTDLKQIKQRTMSFTEKSWSNESNHMHTDGVEKINSPRIIMSNKSSS